MEIIGVVKVYPPSATTIILNVDVVSSSTEKVITTLSPVVDVTPVFVPVRSYLNIGQFVFDDVNFAIYERASSLVGLAVSTFID